MFEMINTVAIILVPHLVQTRQDVSSSGANCLHPIDIGINH